MKDKKNIIHLYNWYNIKRKKGEKRRKKEGRRQNKYESITTKEERKHNEIHKKDESITTKEERRQKSGERRKPTEEHRETKEEGKEGNAGMNELDAKEVKGEGEEERQEVKEVEKDKEVQEKGLEQRFFAQPQPIPELFVLRFGACSLHPDRPRAPRLNDRPHPPAIPCLEQSVRGALHASVAHRELGRVRVHANLAMSP
mgnify:CR=1 FL=1